MLGCLNQDHGFDGRWEGHLREVRQMRLDVTVREGGCEQLVPGASLYPEENSLAIIV